VTGGQDKLIYAFDPFDGLTVAYTLIGHTDNVCTLSVSSTGDIVSGSWDKYYL
jgi:phospholipase A-2-activating protein